MSETAISCIGSAYRQPLADLIVNLHQRRTAFSYMEKDYAISLILLSVAMFEAYMARAAYLALPDDQKLFLPLELEEKVISGKNKTGRDIFLELYPDYSLSVEVEEVYVLRDALTHNHLWEFEQSDGAALRRILGGNSSYRKNVDFDTLKTKSKGLPIVPGNQDWAAASTCFKVLWDAFGYIETKGPSGVVLRSEFNVRIPSNSLPQFKGRITVCLAELFELP